ncbi:hypothetical protein NDU88_008450 [Pleurodeles waltl]|uniref:Uncharacterized protein n=1 Tax=Pleurodeles waltl TaxID=8319 RepID=A0AAV7RSD9_PLEWA|nr:hypothetical protein NDU88_008450 [Pleurodeles waltl]
MGENHGANPIGWVTGWGIMEPSKVVQALKVLQEEGREDLLKEGVLEQVTNSPERTVEFVGKSASNVPVAHPVRQGGARFARRSGASFRQRVAAARRGMLSEGAVSAVGQVGLRLLGARTLKSQRAPRTAASVVGQTGALSAGAHALKGQRASNKGKKQAPSTIESDAEQVELALEERAFGGATNMAAPSEDIEIGAVDIGRQHLSGGHELAALSDMEVVVIDSDGEGDEGKAVGSETG